MALWYKPALPKFMLQYFFYYNTLVLLNVIQWSHGDNLYLPFESLAYLRFQYPGVLSDKHKSDLQLIVQVIFSSVSEPKNFTAG